MNQNLFSKCFSFIALMLIFFSLTSTQAQSKQKQVAAIEERIAQTIKANEASALLLLERAVNINSGTMNFSGVKQLGELFAKEFEELGFDTQWVSAEKFNRSGHLLATFGSKGPKVLLIGHLDTVFAKHSPFQKYQMLSDGRVAGPGITDMKGGDVIIVQALTALKDVGVLNQLQIRVVLTGDEENRGSPVLQASKILLDAGKWADIALGFEDGDGNPATAVTSRRGSSNWHVNVSANAAHSSQIFQHKVGYGAIYEAARILQGFRIALSEEPDLTFSPGLIIGGTTSKVIAAESRGETFGKDNVVAKTAQIRGDIRAVSPQQLARAWKQMHKIVADNLNGTSAEITFDERYPPMASSIGNKQLLSLYSQLSIDHGLGKVVAVNPRNAGAADISFVAADVEMALDGLGLMGSGGHTIDETADIKTLSQQTLRAAVLLYRILEINIQ